MHVEHFSCVVHSNVMFSLVDYDRFVPDVIYLVHFVFFAAEFAAVVAILVRFGTCGADGAKVP